MKVKLLKDWGHHSKDSEIEIEDVSVLVKGNELKVFKISKEELEKLLNIEVSKEEEK